MTSLVDDRSVVVIERSGGLGWLVLLAAAVVLYLVAVRTDVFV